MVGGRGGETRKKRKRGDGERGREGGWEKRRGRE